jgi:hypothetical protein
MCKTVKEANRALSCILIGGKLRDIFNLPAVLSAYRPHPEVNLLFQRRWLQKFHESEVLNFALSANTWQYVVSRE